MKQPSIVDILVYKQTRSNCQPIVQHKCVEGPTLISGHTYWFCYWNYLCFEITNDRRRFQKQRYNERPKTVAQPLTSKISTYFYAKNHALNKITFLKSLPKGVVLRADIVPNLGILYPPLEKYFLFLFVTSKYSLPVQLVSTPCWKIYHVPLKYSLVIWFISTPFY